MVCHRLKTYKAIGRALVCSVVYEECNRILLNVCNSVTRLHGVTIQNAKIFSVIYVRTSQPACLLYKLVATTSFTYLHLYGQQRTQCPIPSQYCRRSGTRVPFCVPCKPRYVASRIRLDAARRRSTRDRSCTSLCRWGGVML